MKYSLRSLMIVVLVLPPLLAVGWRVARQVKSPRPNQRRFISGPFEFKKTPPTSSSSNPPKE